MKPLVVALGCLLISVSSRAEAQLRTELVVSGLSQLVAYVPDPVVPGVFYAVQQSGVVRVVQNGALQPTPFLNLSGLVSTGGEQGLLGMAFSPDVASGRVFVNFTNLQGDTVIARFRRTAANPLAADPATRFDLVWPDPLAPGTFHPYIEQPDTNHNGGHLAFGPDRYLYIGLGDGGGGNDTYQTAQDPNHLLGKMLRIDVNVPDGHPTGYQVPPDNPFVDGVPILARPEIWDFGLRNPWRYNFDDPARGGTGALFIGDVGQGAREEVSYEPAASGARNYGWPMREGLRDTGISRTVALQPLTDPILDYPRSFGTTVTGGYVYRGSALGAPYVGRYFFADFGSGRVWSVAWQPSGSTAVVTDLVEHTSELGSLGAISSFGVGLDGELYILVYGDSGRVLKLASGPVPPIAPSNVSAQVNGQDVTLNWTGSIGALQYRIEVGSRPGVSDLLVYDTGSTATSLTAVGVLNGRYFVRVRAIGTGGASNPSPEIVVTVGCTAPPPSPTNLSAAVAGRNVTVTWAAIGNPTSFVFDVGSGPGLADVARFVLPGSARSIGGMVPPMTYYARMYAVNACGTGPPSGELGVTVP